MSRLPLRSVAGGLILSAGSSPCGPRSTRTTRAVRPPQDFSPERAVEFTEFEAVRWPAGPDGKLKTDAAGKPVEQVAKFKRAVGARVGVHRGGHRRPVQADRQQRRRLVHDRAIRVKGPDDPEPVRYNATVEENPRTKAKQYPQKGERRFVEEKGARYVAFEQPGTLFIPQRRHARGLAAPQRRDPGAVARRHLADPAVRARARARADRGRRAGHGVHPEPAAVQVQQAAEPKPAPSGPAPGAPPLPRATKMCS